MDFYDIKLGDCLSMIENGATIKQQKGSKGLPITRIETLSNNRFNRDRLGYADIFDANKYSHYILDDKDILMSHINSKAFLGRSVLYKRRGNEQIIHGMNVLRIKTKKDILNQEYAYYYFQTSFFKKNIHNIRKDAVNQSSINISDIKDIIIQIPSLKDQKDIVTILSNIDSKIALNRQINDNLEAMARQLYDYWFVQFDFSDENGRPYKSRGGKMVWNEKLKQNIPMGWIVEDISKIADVYNGATPSTKEEQNYGGNIVWITPKDLSDQKSKFVYYGERNITQKGYDSCSTHMLPIDTVLMSSRAPIGLLSIAKSELCTNQGFKSFVPKKETLGSYLYYYILLHIKQIEQLGTGTTFKEISRDDVMTYPILVPKEELLNKWAEFVFPIDNRQFEIQQENNKLTKQCDELLPLLMNGQALINSD